MGGLNYELRYCPNEPPVLTKNWQEWNFLRQNISDLPTGQCIGQFRTQSDKEDIEIVLIASPEVTECKIGFVQKLVFLRLKFIKHNKCRICYKVSSWRYRGCINKLLFQNL